LNVSAACYGSHGDAADNGSATTLRVAPVAPEGEPAQLSGSASKRDVFDDEEALPRKRRRRLSVRIQHLPGE
jgi:hypothetical protein